MSRPFLASLGVLACAAIFAATPVHAAGSATLWFTPQTYSVSPGDQFQVPLVVHPNGESLDTIRANVIYDASVLEAIWFDLGTAFPSLSPGYELDNTTGVATFGAFKAGDRVTSDATVATITFRALKSATTTLTIDSDSKLIHDGEEKINADSLGTATVTIGEGTAVASSTTTDQALEAEALIYFGAFGGKMPSSSVDWEALHCIAYDDCYPANVADRNVSHEAYALQAFGEKYMRMPASAVDWRTLHALAYTDVFYNWASIDAAGL